VTEGGSLRIPLHLVDDHAVYCVSANPQDVAERVAAYLHVLEALVLPYGLVNEFRRKWLAEFIEILTLETALQLLGRRSSLQHFEVLHKHDPAELLVKSCHMKMQSTYIASIRGVSLLKL
jgi:hypothetical protein